MVESCKFYLRRVGSKVGSFLLSQPWDHRFMSCYSFIIRGKKVHREGGLGICAITQVNGAIFVKWVWRIGDEDLGPWHSVILQKFDFESSGRRDQEPLVWASSVSRAVALMRRGFFSNSQYGLGNDARINFGNTYDVEKGYSMNLFWLYFISSYGADRIFFFTMEYLGA